MKVKTLSISLITLFLTGCTAGNMPTIQPTPTATIDDEETVPLTMSDLVSENDLFVISKNQNQYQITNKTGQELYYFLIDNVTAMTALWRPCETSSACDDNNTKRIMGKGNLKINLAELNISKDATHVTFSGWVLEEDGANRYTIETAQLDLE